MKKLTQVCLLFFAASTAFGQVQFQIEWLETSEEYQVSIHSNETWVAPYNTTSTAQITIKVPTGNFEVTDFMNLQEGIHFEANSRHNSPMEAPEFDYISFGLVNIGVKIPYQEGVTLPLFKFKNSLECEGDVFIITNEDVFMPPNVSKANIGNNLTVLGAGGDAYNGNIGEGKVECSFSTDTENLPFSHINFEIFPNPVKEELNVQFNWESGATDAELLFFNNNGKVVIGKEYTIFNGKNTVQFDMTNLPAGIYSLELKTQEANAVIDRVVKL